MAEKEDKNKKQNDDRRQRCVILTLALIGVAVAILLIVVVWRFLSPAPLVTGGRVRKMKWRAGGGSCGCMAGQV